MKGESKKEPVKKEKKETTEVESHEGIDFTHYISKYLEKAYTSQMSNQKHFSVPIQMTILREFCRDRGYSFTIETNPQIGNLAHNVTNTISLLDKKGTLIARASGTSTKYAFNFAPMVREAATEIADTISTGRALAKLGITPDGSFTSEEENVLFQFMRDNSSITEKHMTHTANLFAGLPMEVKNLIKQKNLSVKDFVSFVDNANTPAALFEERVTNYINSLETK